MYRVAHPGLSRKPPSEPRRVRPSLKQSSELRFDERAAEVPLITSYRFRAFHKASISK